jgi:hypothetical protein
MQTITNSAGLTALEHEAREVLPTREAAWHLMRKQQTLRAWACHESGPLLPVRVGNRLGWKTDDIRRLLGVSK